MPKENKTKPSFRLKGRVIFFATNNIHKYTEARSILNEYGIAAGMLRVKALEIQSDSVAEIAVASVVDAFKRCRLPVVVEDAGLFIGTLSGFPGPYAAYTYRTIHNEGILKLMEHVKNRLALFQSVVAYCDSETRAPLTFEGEAKGEITETMQTEAGRSGFGFDPIVQPYGSKKTFAEMTIDEKNGFSHRAKAFRRFADWYRKT